MGKTESEYERLCKVITPLYPNGVRIAYWQKLNRDINKAEARKRKKLQKDMGLR